MHTSSRIALAAAAAAALVAGGAATANAATASPDLHGHHRVAGTVFVQTDSTAHNSVVAYDRLSNGTLRPAGSYRTGGTGGALDGSVVDHTASEGSLVRSGSSLFAVNAGSNTVTSFAIRGDRLVHRHEVSSHGQFPVSVTAHGNRVFVLNARDGGSIQGYLHHAGRLIAVPSWHRTLGLDPNATPEFTHTPAEIAFTPDGSKVVVSTKGNTSAFDVFGFGHAGLAAKPVVTALPNDVPFGFSFDHRGALVTSEAGPNAVASFTVNQDGTLTQRSSVATGQKASCWIVIDGHHVYASNAGSGTVSGYSLGRNGSLTSTGTTATDAGTVDAAATRDGRYLYVQTGAAGIVDEFAVATNGALRNIGAVTVPGAIGAEGIVAS
ncbi:lactonase family protein [Amnibacterium setariae]|uniref:Lactonase family protein n=1 Tax=Amnibacterium setariae TaxID=2306585 RepID=A0A3A1TYJ6_9MICO|nr:beta-propeller fold lactonase family protein [Amnibacterium setariae]RIX28661.1 hypothetical protein D1781_14760 [Amnibacterium setariae]